MSEPTYNEKVDAIIAHNNAGHTHNFDANNPVTWNYLNHAQDHSHSITTMPIFTNTPKEPPMSTPNQIAKERREAREREEAERQFDAWTEIVGSPGEGDVVTFTWGDGDVLKHYAAIYTAKRWRTTDGYEYDTDGFIARLIERKIELTDLQHLEPLT